MAPSTLQLRLTDRNPVGDLQLGTVDQLGAPEDFALDLHLAVPEPHIIWVPGGMRWPLAHADGGLPSRERKRALRSINVTLDGVSENRYVLDFDTRRPEEKDRIQLHPNCMSK